MGIGRPNCLTFPEMEINKCYHSESKLVPTLKSTSVLLKTFGIVEDWGTLIRNV